MWICDPCFGAPGPSLLSLAGAWGGYGLSYFSCWKYEHGVFLEETEEIYDRAGLTLTARGSTLDVRI